MLSRLEGDKISAVSYFRTGPVFNEQAKRMRLAVSVYSNPNIMMSKTDGVVVTKHAAYLSIAVLEHLWQDWEVNHFLKRPLG